MSKATGPKALSDVLSASSRLGRLLRHARQGPDAAPGKLPELPPALAGKAELSIADNCLVITVDNNAVAQIVRFHAPRLTRQAGLPDFRVRLARQQPVAKKPAASEPRLPAGAAPLLQATADQADHPQLAAALRRLAELAEPEDK